MELNKFPISLLIFLCAFQSTLGSRQEEVLDPAGKYTLGWEVDHASKIITFDVKVQTKGFVGFGVNSQGGMTGADIVIGGIDDSGATYFTDYHAVNNSQPFVDPEQNWRIIDASEDESSTYLKFSRLFDTCDSDDYAISEDTITVIWSYGPTDNIGYHGGNRGSKQFNLLDDPQPPVDISDFEIWNVRMNDTMPTVDTSYLCTIHRSPSFGSKRHIVGFSPFIPDGDAQAHTHHFIATLCYAPDGVNADEYFGPEVGKPGWDCNTENTELRANCGSATVYVWAVGGRTFFFPDHVGYPIGENNPREYFMVQLHYDNPGEREEVQFETGFDVYFTNELREMEAGIINVGYELMPTQIIPPKSKDFIVSGHCSPQCTQERVPQNGLHFFNALLHSHLAGRKMRLRHFRNDQELPWVANDDNYNFDFQQNRRLSEEVILLPGDQLTLECNYDTMDRVNATLAGQATYQEMCLSYIYYYPKINLGFCSSLNFPPEEIFHQFGIEEVSFEEDLLNPTVIKPDSLAGKLLTEVLNEFNWTQEDKDLLEENIRYGKHFGVCYHHTDPPANRFDRRNITSIFEKVKKDDVPLVQYPENIENEYSKPSECLPAQDKYRYSWDVDYDRKEVTFHIEVDTLGFVGFGLNRAGSMKGADIVIGGVFPNGTSYFSDRHGVGNTEPIIDEEQNWVLISAREESGTTFLTIKRAWDTCDEKDDIQINGDTLAVLYSFGETDEIRYHGSSNRGVKSAYLLDPIRPDFNETAFEKFELKKEIEMPSDHTTYWCSVHKTPSFDSKQHVVAFRPLIQTPDAIKYTHHFGAYRCILPEHVGDPDEYFAEFLTSNGGHCFDPEDRIQEARKYCSTLLYIWAVGGEMMTFPDNVGYPLGVENPHEYIVLDIHYDNPDLAQGVIVEAGVEVFYTPNLREFDASVLVVGHDMVPSMVIPPKSHNWLAVGHCSPHCTREYFPEGGVLAFNTLLHSHFSGRKMKIRHFRNNIELPWISTDFNYQFDYQQNRPLKDHVRILPGDHLTYECTYDNTWNGGRVTIAGEKSEEEMCYAFLWVYPKPALEFCMSMAMPADGKLETFLAQFGIKGHTWDGIDSILQNNPVLTSPRVLDGLKFEQVLNDYIFWDVERREKLQNDVMFGGHTVHCFGSAIPEPDEETEIIWTEYPDIDKEYEPPQSGQCPDGNNGGDGDENNGAIGNFGSVILMINFAIILAIGH